MSEKFNFFAATLKDTMFKLFTGKNVKQVTLHLLLKPKSTLLFIYRLYGLLLIAFKLSDCSGYTTQN